ncbi:hypothetical protein BHM03_00035290 [Ensete ventricosum]|nr:hypothetical protein BHM03_00035290 [Ensete ventricosum]
MVRPGLASLLGEVLLPFALPDLHQDILPPPSGLLRVHGHLIRLFAGLRPRHDAKDADADREGKGWGKPDSNGGSSGSSGWTCRTASGRHDRRSRSLRCRPENGDSVARFASSAIAAAVSAIQSSKRRRREKGPWLPVRTSKM